MRLCLFTSTSLLIGTRTLVLLVVEGTSTSTLVLLVVEGTSTRTLVLLVVVGSSTSTLVLCISSLQEGGIIAMGLITIYGNGQLNCFHSIS